MSAVEPGAERPDRSAVSAEHPTQAMVPVVPVVLVGGGPGDPDLLTLRAARELAEADVVVHDALVGAGVLALIPEGVERIDVGKRPGRATPQEMISAMLVHLARQGRRVVRLKGGDPFVFGRGGEEALELQRAGIPVEVVPGISSSVAAPAAAGIPVTHRGVSAGYSVVTGHRRPGEPDVDWRALARVGSTIAILMGVAHRGEISAELQAGGLAPATPVAVIQSATTGREVVTRCTLDALGDAAVASPAVIVVGAVAAFDVVRGIGPGETRLGDDQAPLGGHRHQHQPDGAHHYAAGDEDGDGGQVDALGQFAAE